MNETKPRDQEQPTQDLRQAEPERPRIVRGNKKESLVMPCKPLYSGA